MKFDGVNTFHAFINYKYSGAPACSADRLHRKATRKKKTLRPCASAVKIGFD
jgi:hypothetical protein